MNGLIKYLAIGLCALVHWSWSRQLDWSRLECLQIAHDTLRYPEIIEFVGFTGAWTLQSAYELDHIDWQTLLDISALTGFLESFYREKGLTDGERASRTQLQSAIRWAEGYHKIPHGDLAFLPEAVKDQIAQSGL